MRRSLSVVALAVILTSPALHAQVRGGRSGSGGRGGFGPMHTFYGRASHPAGGYSSFGSNRARRTVFFPPPYRYYSPLLLTGTAYGPPYVALDYPGPGYTASTPAAEEAGSANQTNENLANEIRRLYQEIADLRQERTLRAPQPTSPPQPPVRAAVSGSPRVLVFRDGRRLEIQNYAVVGDTLCVLDPKFSPRIPLSELDLVRTQKENRDRGVRLPLP